MLGQPEEQNQGDIAQGKIFVLLLLFSMLQCMYLVYYIQSIQLGLYRYTLQWLIRIFGCADKSA